MWLLLRIIKIEKSIAVPAVDRDNQDRNDRQWSKANQADTVVVTSSDSPRKSSAPTQQPASQSRVTSSSSPRQPLADICIVGGGKMGSALAGGILGSGVVLPEQLVIVESMSDRREALSTFLPAEVLITGDIVSLERSVDSVILAVKPADMENACKDIAALDPHPSRMLSIVAGITIDRLQSSLRVDIPVIRSMPNTPALVGAGVSALAPSSDCTEEDILWAERILGAVGATVRLKEEYLDAVTGLSGSGPAYIFLVAEALVEGGVLVGLDRATAGTLVANTILGAARLWLETGEDPAALRAQVTSPGGTTAAGLSVLEQRAIRAAFQDAVQSATLRSRELGH